MLAQTLLKRSRSARRQHAEFITLWVSQHGPGNLSVSDIDGGGTEIPQALDQLHLMGRGSGRKIKVHAIRHRFDVRDRYDVDAEGTRIGRMTFGGSTLVTPGASQETPQPERVPRTVPKPRDCEL